MSKETAFGQLLSSYIHAATPGEPVTPVNGWVHENFIPPNPVIPPNPIVPLAHEVSSFVHEITPGEPIVPLGQAVTAYLHGDVF